VEDFVIMPDHIHAVIFIHKNAGGASPSPTAILDAEAKKSRLAQTETPSTETSAENVIMRCPSTENAIIQTISPSLNDVLCAFKSFTSRMCKQKYGIEKIFQRSYAEHIIRDGEDYETRRK
jgi:REP element-mobilizing transposase RayT